MTATQIQAVLGTAPTTLAATPVVGGGSFPAGAQFWKVTAIGPKGESAPSNEATATIVLNGQGSLTWVNPPGTTAVKVYRGTVTNAENVLVATLGPVTSYSDTGAAGSAAVPPVAGWVNVTKTGPAPTKASVPAGTPTALAAQVYAAMCEWCATPATATTGGTAVTARAGGKIAAGAGCALQEV